MYVYIVMGIVHILNVVHISCMWIINECTIIHMGGRGGHILMLLDKLFL